MKALTTNLFLTLAILLSSTQITPANNIYISDITPAMNAVSVNKSFDITIVFSQNMNSSTINSANIRVFGFQTGLLTAAVSYNAASKTATINPDQNFKFGELVSVTLTTGILTSSGENISPFVFTFTVQSTGGNGIFTKTSSIPGFQNAQIKGGDIDGDADFDLIANNKIYLNNGTGLFSFSTELSINGIPELADFDNDGDLDVLIQSDSTVYFFQNNGAGVFTLTSSFIGGTGSYGDVNGDGYLDIVFYSNSNRLKYFKNTGGTFGEDTSFAFHEGCSVSGVSYKDVTAVNDMNNDGLQDILTINGSILEAIFYNICRNYFEFRNSADHSLERNVYYSNDASYSNVISTYMNDTKYFDFNGDGFVDVISPDRKLKNNGNGTYGMEAWYSFSNSFNSDFNGDGFIDMTITLPGLPLIMNFNDGNGNFSEGPIYNGEISNGATGDFDNDGDIDIAGFNYAENEISILKNGDIPLPVELTSFNASVNLQNVLLTWTTSSEQNNKGFEIERTSVKTPILEIWDQIEFIPAEINQNKIHNYSYTDRNVNSGKYKYRLKQTDYNGNFEYFNLTGEVTIGVPSTYNLSQNYPNPFNPNTKINFQLPVESFVTLKVYDIKGNEIANLVSEKKEAGYYSVNFNSGNLSSGVYFYKIEAGKFVKSARMILLK